MHTGAHYSRLPPAVMHLPTGNAVRESIGRAASAAIHFSSVAFGAQLISTAVGGIGDVDL